MSKKALMLSILVLAWVSAAWAQSASWQKTFQGTIGTYPVTMHLHKAGDSYYGYYYYTSRHQPILLQHIESQSVDPKNSIRFSSFLTSEPETAETIILNINGSSVSGSWHNEALAKKLGIALTERTLTPVQFDMVYTEGSKPLKPNLKDGPAAHIKAVAVWPKGSSVLADSIKSTVNNFFGKKNSTADIGKLFLGLKKEMFEEYIKEIGEVADSELVTYPSGYSRDEEHVVLLQYESKRLLTLAGRFYFFTGGAHGNYSSSYTTLDRTTGKTFQLKEIITKAGISQLQPLLEKNFRKDRKLSPGASLVDEGYLFENKILPNENFYVTAKGITFVYSPYEIAAYAMGEIYIFIPFTELKPYLQPSFQQFIL